MTKLQVGCGAKIARNLPVETTSSISIFLRNSFSNIYNYPMNCDPKRELKKALIQISEAGYHAGWMLGLEHDVWHAVIDGPKHYGQTFIDAKMIENLKLLSSEAGGWWIFDEDRQDYRFLNEADWSECYSPERNS